MRLDERFAASAAHLAALAPRAHQARSRLAEWTRGGHRPSSLPEATSRSRERPAPRLDRADQRFLATRQRLTQLADEIAELVDELDRLITWTNATTPHQDEPELWCESCLRLQHCSPRGDPRRQGSDTTLCTWCWGWVNSHDGWPPLRLLDKHHRGERITDRQVNQARKKTS